MKDKKFNHANDTLFSTKIIIKKHHRPFLMDLPSRLVQYTAHRKKRPNVRGYGMSPNEAIYNLRMNVQPDFDDKLETVNLRGSMDLICTLHHDATKKARHIDVITDEYLEVIDINTGMGDSAL